MYNSVLLDCHLFCLNYKTIHIKNGSVPIHHLQIKKSTTAIAFTKFTKSTYLKNLTLLITNAYK